MGCRARGIGEMSGKCSIYGRFFKLVPTASVKPPVCFVRDHEIVIRAQHISNARVDYDGGVLALRALMLPFLSEALRRGPPTCVASGRGTGRERREGQTLRSERAL